MMVLGTLYLGTWTLRAMCSLPGWSGAPKYRRGLSARRVHDVRQLQFKTRLACSEEYMRGGSKYQEDSILIIIPGRSLTFATSFSSYRAYWKILM